MKLWTGRQVAAKAEVNSVTISVVGASMIFQTVQDDVLIYSINDNGLEHNNGPWLRRFVDFIRAVSVSQMN